MAGRSEEERLQRIAQLLRDEFVDPDATELTFGVKTLVDEGEGSMGLSDREESLVAMLVATLAKIAATLSSGHDDAADRAVRTALDGAELVIRGEIVSATPDRIGHLMPSFVYLIALPLVGQDLALRLSQRTAELMHREIGP